MYVCVCVGICMLLQVPIEAGDVGSSEAGGTGSHEPLTLVLGAERRSSAGKDMLLTAESSLQPQLNFSLHFPMAPRSPKLPLVSTSAWAGLEVHAWLPTESCARPRSVRGAGGCRDAGLEHRAWSVGRIPVAKVGKWMQRRMLGFL